MEVLLKVIYMINILLFVTILFSIVYKLKYIYNMFKIFLINIKAFVVNYVRIKLLIYVSALYKLVNRNKKDIYIFFYSE